LADKSEH
jgi:hypothetical protein